MALAKSEQLTAFIREGRTMTLRQQLLLTIQLSIPSILAELTSIVMQYIDAAMVGSLGAKEAASIGLVSSSLWLLGGVCGAVATGFSVQVAHHIGANDMTQARSVLRQSLLSCLLFGMALLAIGVGVSGNLPTWLGGKGDIVGDSSTYFFIFSLALPILQLDFLASNMIRCSGNMRIPSMINILMCVLDVVFNFLLIFPTRDVTILGASITIPGAGLGVPGAAIGTVIAELVGCLLMMRYMLFKSPLLKLTQERGSYRPTKLCIKKAVRIGLPMGIQHILLCSAYVATTVIVAPLGNIAIAAHSFAITAESLCYMPGYGIADAATTLVGQSMGARRADLMRRFGRITVFMAMVIMGVMGILMYLAAPLMMGLMSPVQEVVTLGSQVLRIEAFAEPLFGAAIVTYGVMVGAGDTIIPAIMNLGSMWLVRISLSLLLVTKMGLVGVWVAMCIELCFRGLIFLWRLFSEKWIKIEPFAPSFA